MSREAPKGGALKLRELSALVLAVALPTQVLAWGDEGHEIVATIAFVDDHGGKGERLDATYVNRALPVVREPLSKGGVRLAAVLNDALK